MVAVQKCLQKVLIEIWAERNLYDIRKEGNFTWMFKIERSSGITSIDMEETLH
jgi:hypothetical protein